MKAIKAIDICCGAGGFACAARGLPIEFVAVADLAGDCLETWAINHGAAHLRCELIQADISTKAGMAQVLKAAKAAGGVDCILGAISCEQLSCARANRPLKAGELEAVHALIDQVFAAVKKLKPRWWCFEDVTQIENHLEPQLTSPVPYECRRIQAADYGPQKRLRTFFGRFPELAPPEPGPRILADVLRPGPYRTLPQLKKYQRSKSRWYGGDKIRVQELEDPSDCVIGSQGGTGSRGERGGMVPLARILDASKACPTVMDGEKNARGFLVNAQARNLDPAEPSPAVTGSFYCDERTVPLTSRERPQALGEPSRAVLRYREGAELPVPVDREPFGRERPLDPEQASRTPAVGSGGGNGLLVEGESMVRVMEWTEAALLQGFPEDYIFAASWSRTWKLVAQAISVHVGKAILKGMVDANHQRRK